MDVNHLSFYYEPDQWILKNVNFTIPKGKVTTLMGANGCGKTTLLHLMTKNLQPQKGEIYLENQSIQSYSIRAFAQKVAMVHQKNISPNDLLVRKFVAYGRIPYTSIWKSSGAEYSEKVIWAMKVTGIFSLADRQMGTLSGGQRQRVFIAMALAQDTKILFLDEPTTFLDIRYQIEILRLIRSLNQQYQMTIVMVLHDINQALYYSDEVIGLKNGKLRVQGAPSEVVTSEIIQELYGIQLEVFSRQGKMCVMAVE